jgi:hypothetical protein
MKNCPFQSSPYKYLKFLYTCLAKCKWRLAAEIRKVLPWKIVGFKSNQSYINLHHELSEKSLIAAEFFNRLIWSVILCRWLIFRLRFVAQLVSGVCRPTPVRCTSCTFVPSIFFPTQTNIRVFPFRFQFDSFRLSLDLSARCIRNVPELQVTCRIHVKLALGRVFLLLTRWGNVTCQDGVSVIAGRRWRHRRLLTRCIQTKESFAKRYYCRP